MKPFFFSNTLRLLPQELFDTFSKALSKDESNDSDVIIEGEEDKTGETTPDEKDNKEKEKERKHQRKMFLNENVSSCVITRNTY